MLTAGWKLDFLLKLSKSASEYLPQRTCGSQRTNSGVSTPPPPWERRSPCCIHKLAILGLPPIHLPLPPAPGRSSVTSSIWFHMGSSYPQEETHILSKFFSHWALSSAPKEALLFFSKYVITCVCLDTPLPRYAHRVQRTTLWRWLSLSCFVCVLGIELWLSGLPASTLSLGYLSGPVFTFLMLHV